ncbi:hypothetical protein JMK10_00280 [Rhodovulum sulfidophilum]|uniref:hypothetical protein n=1 Tax=Rhodovulum sulfidophilum TaxID=35806 RepID=UPI0019218171|nr:hypothetical protein [Rhodovulum sulfidophilum]MBL3575592.1 hypothetical protein [Rhodovulum sulfidophilum]MCE8431779.1 hypothetical protein [Rhodovulum sulfidophilum]MCF4115299.1 hypothetical protein [Rhodovulum sulfidophilum]
MKRRTFFAAAPLAVLPGSGVALADAPQLDQASAVDPLVTLYREWLSARREWRELADLPGNENWDDPRSLAAEARENDAEDMMLALKPASLEGIAALAALAWSLVIPGRADAEVFEVQVQSYDCRAIAAIWKACTGLDGYPVI